jgi:hypothetical protein
LEKGNYKTELDLQVEPEVFFVLMRNVSNIPLYSFFVGMPAKRGFFFVIYINKGKRAVYCRNAGQIYHQKYAETISKPWHLLHQTMLKPRQ